MNIQKPSRALAGILVAGLAFSSAVFADFKGGDTLKTVIASNWYYSPGGGGTFENGNSRLDFLVKTPATNNSAFLTWKVNEGSPSQNWYVQADAYLDLIRFPVNGDGMELGLGIVPSENNGPRGLTLALNRNRNNNADDAGISVINSQVSEWEERTTAGAAQLRLHYDKNSQTITPSWNVGSGWKYGAPRDLATWDMKPSETFRAFLFARSGVAGRWSAWIVPGQAYFKNFKVGNAAPEILVAKGASELQDKKGTVLFGAAKTGVGKVTKTFRIRNDGTAVLTGLNLSIIGGQAGDFAFSNIGKKSLAPGDSTTFKIAFQPKASEVRNATVFLTSNDADESSFEIKVSGRGVK
ncbi:MAG: choice-of-anchor D domain-containing protein [Luteolibacter sp.]|uniref:choice-of-anchor D domain-containing protein n=1 Tax=Luteolibacter sp. TaxID=1962973 RepID=UPI003267C5E5